MSPNIHYEKLTASILAADVGVLFVDGAHRSKLAVTGARCLKALDVDAPDVEVPYVVLR